MSVYWRQWSKARVKYPAEDNMCELKIFVVELAGRAQNKFSNIKKI